MQLSIHNYKQAALLCNQKGEILEKNLTAIELDWIPKIGQPFLNKHQIEIFDKEKSLNYFFYFPEKTKIFAIVFQKQEQFFYLLLLQQEKNSSATSDFFSKQEKQLIKLQKQLQQAKNLIIKDPLTGLFNHSYWQQLIENFQEQVFCLLLIDLDNFKHYNDSYGHLAGDLLLKKFASTIQAKIRKQDLAIRYAGDEFLVIIKNTDLGMLVSQKIQKEINKKFHSIITVSIGVAVAPKNGKDLLQLFQFADKNLYLSKKLGKNKIHYENKPLTHSLL